MKRTTALLLMSSFGLLNAAYGASPDCFVNAAASTVGDGKTWATAFSDLQSALTESSCIEVWVAKGVYKPTATGDRTASFNIRPATRVYGGFIGNERELPERNIEANTTILSGDIDGNDANAASTEIDAVSADIRGFNSYHVVQMDGTSGIAITITTILDGFTITGGYAERTSGGGLYCNGGTDGGRCSPTLSNMVFSGNYADYLGGAVINDGSVLGDSSGRFIHVVFSGNSANRGGGAVANYGFYGGQSSPTFDSCLFSNNTVTSGTGGGGAMFNEAYRGGVVNPLTIQSLFLNNSAYFGGAIGNIAGQSSTINPVSENTTFVNNVGYAYGGAIYTTGERAGVANVTLNNATFSGNQGRGPAMSLDDYEGSATITSTISNTIAWDTSPDGVEFEINSTSVPEINTSIVTNGCPSGATCSDITSANPLLSQLADHGGATLTMLPLPGSPAIDNGDDSPSICPDVDQRNVDRPQGTHCDIGAVERQPIEDIIFRNGFKSF